MFQMYIGEFKYLRLQLETSKNSNGALKYQIATLKNEDGLRYLSYAFTNTAGGLRQHKIPFLELFFKTKVYNKKSFIILLLYNITYIYMYNNSLLCKYYP